MSSLETRTDAGRVQPALASMRPATVPSPASPGNALATRWPTIIRTFESGCSGESHTETAPPDPQKQVIRAEVLTGMPLDLPAGDDPLLPRGSALLRGG